MSPLPLLSSGHGGIECLFRFKKIRLFYLKANSVLKILIIFILFTSFSSGACDANYPEVKPSGTSLEKALCLQGRDCVPKYTCENLLDVPNYTICLDSLYDKNGDCLVYSFGISREYGFDITMGRLGCEVHMFDPTVNYPTNFSDHVYFHKWGLFGGGLLNESSSVKVIADFNFGKLGWEMKTLSEIETLLGHRERRLSILKIDCEGCEWETLGKMSLHGQPFRKAKQLLLELHFSTNLGVGNRNQVSLIGNAFDLLWPLNRTTNHGVYGQFYHHENPGYISDRNVYPELLEGGFPKDVCCREVGYVHMSCLDRRNNHAQRAASLARAKRNYAATFESSLIRKGKEIFFVRNGSKHSFPTFDSYLSYGYTEKTKVEPCALTEFIPSGLNCCTQGQGGGGCFSCL